MVEKKKRTSLEPDKSAIQTVATSLIPEPGSSPRPESVLNWSNAIFLLQRNKGMLALGTQTDFLTNGGGGPYLSLHCRHSRFQNRLDLGLKEFLRVITFEKTET